MVLQRGFLQSKVLRKISGFRFFVGIVLGLLFALSLYGLQYLGRESFRIFSLSNDGDIWIFTDSEVSFYNLVFAAIAVIFGQSITLAYWFDRPAKNFKASATRIRDIVNDQRVMNWYFMAWFSKLTLAYIAVFGFAGLGWFYLNSFYPDYNYLFVLVIVVLFLQTWNSLLRTFRKKAFRWMLFSAVTIAVVSFGMSKINLIDYQNLNEVLTSTRVDVKYKLELPSTSYSDTIVRLYPKQPTISLALSKESGLQNEPVVSFGNKATTFDDLVATLLQKKNAMEDYERYQLNWFLAIDKDISMAYVHQLLETMAMADIEFLRYLVIPAHSDLDYRYHMFYKKTSIRFYNPCHFLNPYEERVQSLTKYANLIKVEIREESCSVNNRIMSLDDLKHEIARRIISDKDYVITYTYSEGLSFGNYFRGYTAIRGAIRELRDLESDRLAKKDFNELQVSYNTREIQKSIIEKFPLRILNVSPDLKHMDQLLPDVPSLYDYSNKE